MMTQKNISKYANKVFWYWQMEYDHHIGDTCEDLLNNHVLSMIVIDCYKLKIKPCNCCAIIHNAFFSLDDSISS
jgi:hypothetical protein